MSKNYIATWFYKESAEEASYYPQMGRKGNSSLAHSVYMQIQVPFFVTFHHYNQDCRFLFFTNIKELPDYLITLFDKLGVEIVVLDYTCAPPKGWHDSWTNQFFLYDILKAFSSRMDDDDILSIVDADCVCQRSLLPFFDNVRKKGCGLYELHKNKWNINGLSQTEAENIYTSFYGVAPSQALSYYGGEFISLRGDKVKEVNAAYGPLWNYNLQLFQEHKPKLNEEALFFSVLAERLHLRNNDANPIFRRIWTNPEFFMSTPEDLFLSVWHLPYEKRRGLHYLYNKLTKDSYEIADEKEFWAAAARYCGIPVITKWKKFRDLCQKVHDVFIR